MNSRVVLLGQSHALFLKWAAYFDGKSESILLLVRHQLQAKDRGPGQEPEPPVCHLRQNTQQLEELAF